MNPRAFNSRTVKRCPEQTKCVEGQQREAGEFGFILRNALQKILTETGIKLSNKWDLATLDKANTVETHEYGLQRCEKCGKIIGTKKHLL